MEVLIFFSIFGGKKVLFRIPSPLWLYLLCSPCCAGIGLAASEPLCAEPKFSGNLLRVVRRGTVCFSLPRSLPVSTAAFHHVALQASADVRVTGAYLLGGDVAP